MWLLLVRATRFNGEAAGWQMCRRALGIKRWPPGAVSLWPEGGLSWKWNDFFFSYCAYMSFSRLNSLWDFWRGSVRHDVKFAECTRKVTKQTCLLSGEEAVSRGSFLCDCSSSALPWPFKELQQRPFFFLLCFKMAERHFTKREVYLKSIFASNKFFFAGRVCCKVNGWIPFSTAFTSRLLPIESTSLNHYCSAFPQPSAGLWCF